MIEPRIARFLVRAMWAASWALCGAGWVGPRACALAGAGGLFLSMYAEDLLDEASAGPPR